MPGEEGLLHWYSVDGPAPVHARTRPEALDYFAARHARHEGLRLLTVQYAAAERDDNVGITYTLARQADDVPAHEVLGKAVFACAGGAIVKWAMGPGPYNDRP